MTIVSACLLGRKCKYDGGDNYSRAIASYLVGKDFVAVCPEVLGGLSIPRKKSEIRDGKVVNEEGLSVDREFRLGALKAYSKAEGMEIEEAILKSRSPSCGVGEVYDGTFTGRVVKGNGVFASLLSSKGIKLVSSDEFAPMAYVSAERR